MIIKDSLRTEQYDYKHLNGKFLVIIIRERLRDEVIIITTIINASEHIVSEREKQMK